MGGQEFLALQCAGKECQASPRLFPLHFAPISFVKNAAALTSSSGPSTSTQAFKVQVSTKNKKWSCPTCGLKQSVVKIYGKGPKAKDLRQLVQDLNMRRCEAEETVKAVKLERWENGEEGGWDDDDEAAQAAEGPRQQNAWAEYIEEEPRPVRARAAGTELVSFRCWPFAQRER